MSTSISKMIEINTSAANVFRSLTEPEEITKHFPYEYVESDGCVGGTFTCFGTASDHPFTDHGTITEFNPGEKFSYRYWSTNHGTERSVGSEVSLTYEIDRREEGCILQVTQSNLPNAGYTKMMEPIWDHLLGVLKRNVESKRT